MVKWTIFLVVVYVQAMSAAPAPDARTYYAQGLTAITAKKWSDAEFALEMSYRLNANSMTAYLLALASSRLGNIGDTETWAVVSLTDEPPLPKHYKFQAVKLISWAVAMSAKVTVVRWRYLLSRDQPTSHNLALLEALSEVRLPGVTRRAGRSKECVRGRESEGV